MSESITRKVSELKDVADALKKIAYKAKEQGSISLDALIQHADEIISLAKDLETIDDVYTVKLENLILHLEKIKSLATPTTKQVRAIEENINKDVTIASDVFGATLGDALKAAKPLK